MLYFQIQKIKIHFAFGFSTQSVSDLLKFYITLIDDKDEQIAFEKNENGTCNSIIWIRWKKLIKNLSKT